MCVLIFHTISYVLPAPIDTTAQSTLFLSFCLYSLFFFLFLSHHAQLGLVVSDLVDQFSVLLPRRPHHLGQIHRLQIHHASHTVLGAVLALVVLVLRDKEDKDEC